VSALLASVDKGYGAELLDMLGQHGIQATSIAAVLREDGHSVGPAAIQRHRRGACRCEA
jgi:hypothetical protein